MSKIDKPFFGPFEINEPTEITPKQNHFMIFIPKYIVFIVGGQNLDTFYYKLKEKYIYVCGKLNIIRKARPLQIIKNKLYVILKLQMILVWKLQI